LGLVERVHPARRQLHVELRAEHDREPAGTRRGGLRAELLMRLGDRAGVAGPRLEHRQRLDLTVAPYRGQGDPADGVLAQPIERRGRGHREAVDQ